MNIPTSRRQFVLWTARLGTGALAAGSGLGLTGCGGGEPSPFDEFTVLRFPSRVSLIAEPRKVQWVPGLSPTQPNAWAYVIKGAVPAGHVLTNHLGPVIEVRRGQACTVNWSNGIPATSPGALLLSDPPIHVPVGPQVCGQVRLQSPVALVTHLHGARVQGSSDGWPLAPLGFAGNPYGFPQTRGYTYPNRQRATLLWYHDHAMDRTGPHVHAGLVGLYVIRDAADDALTTLIGSAERELPCVIQDRILTADQLGIDYAAGMPEDAPDDDGNRPEFLGHTLFVNGHPSPRAELARRLWRVRLLNGCNSRTLALGLCDLDALAASRGRIWYTDRMRLIGGDGGFISRSLPQAATGALLMGPAQRRDVLLDLSQLPTSVRRLRLVNLCLQPLIDATGGAAEAIFTTEDDSLLLPHDADFNTADTVLYQAVRQQALARVLDLDLPAGPPRPRALLPTATLDALLGAAASDDDFLWNGRELQPLPNVPFGPNRLVLLMSNTLGFNAEETGNGVTGWGDVQIFEMVSPPAQPGAPADWQLPFSVDLGTSQNPPAAQPTSTQQGYTLARRHFFARASNPDITLARAYPTLHEPVIRARAGSYERWYVANIGNTQPLSNAAGDPDMHPFHVHLVNFVVTRRWQLTDGAEGRFQPAPADALDSIARQDTVLIPSGQLVELLVYYPPGYRGDFAFHCHLLEHEDMCMMSHFNVS
jgi:FtsP/CotA-like multicopper oxidase with cupredoxin domain